MKDLAGHGPAGLGPVRRTAETVRPSRPKSCLLDQLDADRIKITMRLQMIGCLCVISLGLAQILVINHVDLLVFGSMAWLAMSLVVAAAFIGSGQRETGHGVATVNLVSLVTAIASVSGGMGSFMAPWLLLVPVSAFFSASWFHVAMASLLSAAGLIWLYVAEAMQVLPQPRFQFGSPVLNLLGMATAMIYAGAHGFGGLWLWFRFSCRLEAQESGYRLVVDNLADILSVHDKAGSAIQVSENTERVLGLPPGKLHGPSFLDVIHFLDRDAFIDACARAIAGAHETEIEMRMRRLTGNAGNTATATGYIWVRSQFRPYWNHGNPLSACVVASSDISSQKTQEKYLGDIHEAANRADKAKSRLLANVTHELRTPLNAIIGFSDILKEELDRSDNSCLNKEMEKYVDLINESGMHLLQVVNGFLQMAKIDSPEHQISMEKFDLSSMLETTMQMIGPFAAQSGVRLHCELAETLGSIVADKKAVRQIVINLLSNAVKFSSRGSTVTLGAGVGEHAASLWVEDEGIGISKMDLGLIGKPFFQVDENADRNYQGTGLGLAVVKKLVDLHHGSVAIQSEPGKGTTVRISLPVGTTHLPEMETAPGPDSAPICDAA